MNYEAKYQFTKVEIIISVSKYIRLVCDHYTHTTSPFLKKKVDKKRLPQLIPVILYALLFMCCKFTQLGVTVQYVFIDKLQIVTKCFHSAENGKRVL